jgi:uncharacterized short protein YbdD (DUF466 family)
MKHLSALWNLLRTLASDDAYERYLAHHENAHPDAVPLTRREFYLCEQQKKWGGVSRCC